MGIDATSKAILVYREMIIERSEVKRSLGRSSLIGDALTFHLLLCGEVGSRLLKAFHACFSLVFNEFGNWITS